MVHNEWTVPANFLLEKYYSFHPFLQLTTKHKYSFLASNNQVFKEVIKVVNQYPMLEEDYQLFRI